MANPADTEHAMQCMEIVGGNRAVRQSFRAPGLEIWIDSRPLTLARPAAEKLAAESGGGDVHYLSTCGAGYVTRLALADLAGHGQSVDSQAVSLRKLMRKYINTLDQTRFAKSLNEELSAGVEAGRFATAVLLTYFAPTSHLIICNAGHGRPLRYSAKRGKWQFLDLNSAGDCPSLHVSKARYHLERVANLPLGVLEPMDYEQFAVDFAAGDVVLLYTDAITESTDAAGNLLGETGLLSMVENIDSEGMEDIGEHLLRALDRRDGDGPAKDDRTLIVVRRADTQPPRPSIGRTVSTLAKMVGLRHV
jgi:phosphoserine phosphatase RsbU/P